MPAGKLLHLRTGVFPRGPAHPLFMLVQVGYLALYGVTLVQVGEISAILTDSFGAPASYAFVIPAILAMCGVAIRIFLIATVGWSDPLAARRYTALFPVLLVFDAIWAASPLLIWHAGDNYGLALAGVALLAFSPFVQLKLARALRPMPIHR